MQIDIITTFPQYFDSPLKIGQDLHWAILSEIDEAEVLIDLYIFLSQHLLFYCILKKSIVIPAERTALTVAYKDIYQVRAVAGKK